MKKILSLVFAAVMTMTVQAQFLGWIEVGDYYNPTEVYNSSYFDMAPTNFYLAHTGVQMIFTPDMLSVMADKEGVSIKHLNFKFHNETFEEIVRNAKVYLQEIDATEFAVVKEVKQFFPFENPVMEVEQTYEMLNYYGEDMDVEFTLPEPFALASGKNLLVTIVFDAQDDDNCTMGSDYAPFYTSGIRNKGMVYTDNWTSFVDFAQGEDFPDATAMLGCGTNVELPVTKIGYTYNENATGIEEIEAATASDNAYYNLMGQKFSADNLPAGIYIHNGRKVLVK